VSAGETKSLGCEIIFQQLAELDIVVYNEDILYDRSPPRQIIVAWLHYNQTPMLFCRVSAVALHFFTVLSNI
jgi:hypothetical protein